STRLGKKLQKLIDVYNKDDNAQTRVLADEILASADGNAYDKSLSAQLAAQASYNLDDNAAAKAYLQQALENNGLANNNHYQAMLMLAQLQLADDEIEPGLATLDRYLSETGSTKPEDLALKGPALYPADRCQGSTRVLEQAVAPTPASMAARLPLRMACHAEAKQHGAAIALAERPAAKDPADKTAHTNPATVYAQADRMDRAAAGLAKLRAAGQL